MHRRYHVTYEDVGRWRRPMLRHRILLNFHAESDKLDARRHPETHAGCEAARRRA